MRASKKFEIAVYKNLPTIFEGIVAVYAAAAVGLMITGGKGMQQLRENPYEGLTPEQIAIVRMAAEQDQCNAFKNSSDILRAGPNSSERFHFSCEIIRAKEFTPK